MLTLGLAALIALPPAQVTGATLYERGVTWEAFYESVEARRAQWQTRTSERVERKMSWYDWDRGDSTLKEIVALAENG